MKRPWAGLMVAGTTLAILVLALVVFRGERKAPGPSQLRQGNADAVSNSVSACHPVVVQNVMATSSDNSIPRKFGGILAGLSGDTVERKPQIDKLVEEMSTADRVTVLDQLWAEESVGAQRELTDEILRKWAHEMPEAAAEWLSRKPAGTMQREASKAVAIIWANQNLADTANWVRRWPEEEKESGLLAVAYEAVRTSPKEALWLASELSAAPTRDELIAHAVREWASREATAPVAWAEKMENSTLRDQVFASAAISLSESDPVGAANLALQKLSPGGRQDNTVVSIVQRWAQTEPTGAAEWVTRFPQGGVRDAAVENLVQVWADKEAEQTAGWLNRLEPGPVRDVGLAAYARKLAPTEPTVAMDWAATISNTDLRDREIESLAALWMQSDRPAASAWVQAAPVSDEIKTRMLKSPF